MESFCKECFITDSKEKDHVFTIARHFADWQKHRQKPTWSKKDEDIFNKLIAYFISDMFLNHTEEDIVNWLKSLKDKMQPQNI